MTGPRAIGYHELIRRVQHGDASARVPLQGTFELTYRCNLRCTHCWVNLPPSHARARARELAIDEIARIAGEVVDAGCLWLLLTGGEIFVRPDFPAIYRDMKRRGLLLTLYTNGTLITPRVADLLAEYPPARVEISLYGVTPATYAAVTGAPALDRCLRGIGLLLDRSIKVRLKSVVTTANYDEFLGMAAFARREFGLPFAYDPNLNFRKVEGRDAMTPASVRVDVRRVIELDRALDADTGDLERFYRRDQRLTTDHLFTCGAAINTFHVDPYGALGSCMMVPSISYDLRHGSFRQGWAELGEAIVERRKSSATRCDTCSIAAACDTCPGWSTLEHADLHTPVDYLCAINHARAEAFRPADRSRAKRSRHE